MELTPNGRPRRLRSLTKVVVDKKDGSLTRMYMNQTPTPPTSEFDMVLEGNIKKKETPEDSGFASAIINKIDKKLKILDSNLSAFSDSTNRTKEHLRNMEMEELEFDNEVILDVLEDMP